MVGMGGMAHGGAGMSVGSGRPTRPPVSVMTLLSFLVLAGAWHSAFWCGSCERSEGGSAARSTIVQAAGYHKAPSLQLCRSGLPLFKERAL